ncbi:STM2901 family protein [Erwinia sp.]|uniref:STM2901 family protein n=1 Tax=Erwinia citreus TaxID=558 RepID=UPI003C71B296
MDTVEQLNGTYFYAGRSNLTAGELLFMIFCEKTVDQFGLGLADFGAVVAILSGRNDLTTRTKPGNALEGTSHASKTSRKVFKNMKFPFGKKLPTWIGGYTPWTVKRRMTAKIGTFVGRTIPLLGNVIIAADVSQIIYYATRDYNMIARGDDKIW